MNFLLHPGCAGDAQFNTGSVVMHYIKLVTLWLLISTCPLLADKNDPIGRGPAPSTIQSSSPNPSEYDWSQTSASWPALTAGQLASITLSPCPRGVVADDVDQYVSLNDGPNEEAVMLASWVRAGTCTSGQPSGTISFYPSRNHAAGTYTIKSASGGLQEALNASRITFAGTPRGGTVRVPSGTQLDIYAKVSVHGWNETLDLSGSQIKIHQSDTGLCIGDCAQQWKANTYFAANIRMLVPTGKRKGTFISITSGQSGDSQPLWDTETGHTTSDGGIKWMRIGGVVNSSRTYNATVMGPRVQPAVDEGTFAAISVNANKTRLFNLSSQFGYAPKGHIYTFGTLLEVDDDQAFLLDGLDISTGLGTIRCDTSFCGSYVTSPGPFNVGSAVGWLKNMNLSAQCDGNGVDWMSGNTLHISDSVIQGYNQFGVRYSMKSGGYGGLMMDNVYMEYGSGCSNPLYLSAFPNASADAFAAAGIIVQGGSNFTNPTFSYRGGEGPAGSVPMFTGAGKSGPTSYNYYVIAYNNRENSYSVPILFGQARPTVAGKFKIAWPDMPDARSFDILRVDGQGGAAMVAPYGSGPYAVQTGLLRSSVCANGLCTSEDTQARPTQYTVQASALGKVWVPFANWWPGAVVLESTGSGPMYATNMPTYYTDLLAYNATISFSGGTFPQIYALQCGNSGAGQSSPSWPTCLNGYYGQPFRYMTGTQTGGSPFAQFIKGKLNVGYNSASSGPLHLITLFDSNPDKSSAYGAARAHLCTAPGYDSNTMSQRYQGEWSGLTIYKANDWVRHNGHYYIDTNGSSQRIVPPDPPWVLMSCDIKDVFIGVDGGGPANVGLSLGSSGSISRYIDNIGDGTRWLERLTLTAETFRVPVQVDSTLKVGEGGSSINQIAIFSTASIAPQAVAPRTCSDQTFGVSGLTTSDVVGQVTPPSSLGSLDVIGYPASAGRILLHFCNMSASPITPPSGIYKFSAIR
jgi:hypothetical protein